MLEDSYLCEANIEAAQLMIEREWKKSSQIKNTFNAALYCAVACLYPCSVKEYWSVLFYTHGGC